MHVLVVFSVEMNYGQLAIVFPVFFSLFWCGFESGISLDQPIVTSCGTGVTACVLALVSFSGV